jgi:hypothetical protein
LSPGKDVIMRALRSLVPYGSGDTMNHFMAPTASARYDERAAADTSNRDSQD